MPSPSSNSCTVADTATRYSFAGIGIALFIGTVSLASPSVYGNGGSSLCAEEEQTVFSCKVRKHNKILAICASKDLSKSTGYLQYRFGRPGSLDLVFPIEKETSRQQFSFARYTRYQVAKVAVVFRNNDHSYSVFDNYDGESGTPTRERGVAITGPDEHKKPMTYLCSQQAVSSLSKLESVLSCDPELSFGGCKAK